jgi:hypothetical protein
MIDENYPSVSVNEWGSLVCDHSAETAIRRRIQSNNVAIVCRQCLTCGANLGAIKKTSPEVMKLITIEPFDDTIIDFWRGQCDLHREERMRRQEETRDQERTGRYAAYSAYLKTDTWKKKRALVLDRADGMCEGCGVNYAVQVHHLTYEHLGDEFLWELKAVCLRCHRKAHPDKDAAA